MQSPTSIPEAADPVKLHLLEVAANVFAEQGFKSTTIRDICGRAGANVAAINYHFGGKEGLYEAVFRFASCFAQEKYPFDAAIDASRPPAERLHEFVQQMLRRMLSTEKPAWFGKLMAREMIEPSAVLDAKVRDNIRPTAMLLGQIITAVVGHDLMPEQLRHATCSVIGQCLFYHHARPVIERLFPEQGHSPDEVERLADHITRFSIAGLSSLRTSSEGAS